MKQYLDHFKMVGSTSMDESRYKSGYHLNGFTKPYLPVIRSNAKGHLFIDLLKWGLTPSWILNPDQFKANTLNARNDELFEKPSYQNYWMNRCLVIASGFFEPRDRKLAGLPEPASPIQVTESWYIKHAQNEFLTLGAIFCNQTLSIITTQASPLMETIHNDGKRMPLILENSSWEQWLQPDLDIPTMSSLMKTHPEDTNLMAYRTIDGIFNNKIDTDVPEAILPGVNYTSPPHQLSLF